VIRNGYSRLSEQSVAPASIGARLLDRRQEIIEMALVRVSKISALPEPSDPEYVNGFRAALTAAIDFGLSLEDVREEEDEIPRAVLSQARLAARKGVRMDAIVRRYMAGYAILAGFLVQEAELIRLRGAALQSLLDMQARRFDRLLAGATAEYIRAQEATHDSNEMRRAAQISRLLDGDRGDAQSLGYAFEGWHLAAVASGPLHHKAFRERASKTKRQPLAVRPAEETLWVWFGGREEFAAEEVRELTDWQGSATVSLAFGEPGKGLAGWRRSHMQAKATLPIVQRGEKSALRYSEVALIASALQDELLVSSLRTMYLDALAGERDGGRTLRETLEAYFCADRNVSSAAALLGVSRATVTNRLRAIEEATGCSISGAASALELALQIEALEKIR
jgi:PucR-like helix-turn-helix protein/diguanylate cyclase with GGDEF domain